jgi:hypothetical protein
MFQEKSVDIKNEIKFVKAELSGDEKVLESVFRLESFYAKHKAKLWALVAGVVVFFGVRAAMDMMHEANLVKANEAFLVLQKNSTDTQALETLKENNLALFELYSLAQGAAKKDVKALEALSASANTIIADASRYTAGILAKKPVDSELYHELSLFVEAYLAIGTGDTKQAKEKLSLINERSPLFLVSEFLNHSMIKVSK